MIDINDAPTVVRIRAVSSLTCIFEQSAFSTSASSYKVPVVRTPRLAELSKDGQVQRGMSKIADGAQGARIIAQGGADSKSD